MAVFALMAAGLLIMAWTSWYFFQKSQQDLSSIASEPKKTVPVNQEPIDQSTSLQQGQLQQTVDSTLTLGATKDSSIALQAARIQPIQGFSVVLEVSKRNRAISRYADLREWGHKVQMSTQDSLTFKLSIPIDAPLSDSIRHRDSLSRFFGKKVWIETN
jgi:hypothetical protein